MSCEKPNPKELLLFPLSTVGSWEFDIPTTGEEGEVSVSSVIPPPVINSCKEALLEIGDIEASFPEPGETAVVA
jgi:hypothetical protein